MIAADTSAWIAFFEGCAGDDVQLLDRALKDRQVLMIREHSKPGANSNSSIFKRNHAEFPKACISRGAIGKNDRARLGMLEPVTL
jgi:hypothetical protein